MDDKLKNTIMVTIIVANIALMATFFLTGQNYLWGILAGVVAAGIAFAAMHFAT